MSLESMKHHLSKKIHLFLSGIKFPNLTSVINFFFKMITCITTVFTSADTKNASISYPKLSSSISIIMVYTKIRDWISLSFPISLNPLFHVRYCCFRRQKPWIYTGLGRSSDYIYKHENLLHTDNDKRIILILILEEALILIQSLWKTKRWNSSAVLCIWAPKFPTLATLNRNFTDGVIKQKALCDPYGDSYGNDKTYPDQLKLRVYSATVLSVLLYGAETRPLSKTLAQRLHGLDSRALPSLEGIR